MPAFDDEVRGLAAEISEARVRLGIPDQDVFGSGGLFSVRTLQLQLRDAVSTVQEGIGFFSLGVRMLASDVYYSGQVFTRASLGNTLKPREVSVRCLRAPPHACLPETTPLPQIVPSPDHACPRRCPAPILPAQDNSCPRSCLPKPSRTHFSAHQSNGLSRVF